MVGRRQIREKVLQFVYAYNKNGVSIENIENQTLKNVKSIFDLYVYQLNLLIAIKDVAIEKYEASKKKNFATEEELNPNMKFVNNMIFKILENNQELKKYTEKHKELTWNEFDNYPNNIFIKLQQTQRFAEYLRNEVNEFEEDKNLIIRLFNKYISDNEALIEKYEEQQISWVDDFHIANSMTLKTLKRLEEYSDFQTLIPIFKDEEDIEFLKNLLHQTLAHQEKYLKMINERSKNWSLDRITDIDKIILSMAFCELEYFPQTPKNVVLNEYIELAKIFSTEKSNIFINGMLDKYCKEIAKN